jgi:hypothetical protein
MTYLEVIPDDKNQVDQVVELCISHIVELIDRDEYGVPDPIRKWDAFGIKVIGDR